MEGEILAAVAGALATAGSVVRALARDVAGALVAAGVALIAFAAVLSNL